VMTIRLPANSDMSGDQARIVECRHHLHAAHVARLVRRVIADRIVDGADVVRYRDSRHTTDPDYRRSYERDLLPYATPAHGDQPAALLSRVAGVGRQCPAAV